MYPTERDQDVTAVCQQIYASQFRYILQDTQGVTMTHFHTEDGGIEGYFTNGEVLFLPIVHGLPVGERFACRPRKKNYRCGAGHNWEARCKRNGPP